MKQCKWKNKSIDKKLIISLMEIKEELKKKSKNKPSSMNILKLNKDEQKLINQIKENAQKHNINNVTRTRAYLHFFLQYPEIHWAFLGHLVSRNGGWNMTDLKGELLSKLLSEKEQRDYFLLLERGNWLIFQDVFPQFLLYEQSLRENKSLFYLLPYLNVSTFMETMWNHFWNYGNRYLLAVATIINEQSYLEKRVIQNKHFKNAVLDTLWFKLHDFLRFNHIIFPYEKKGKKKVKLIGDTLQHFASLHERIRLGKRLYSLLFGREMLLQDVLRWAGKYPHTGSRKDYWTHLFNDVNESLPGSMYQRKTKNCQLKKGVKRIYSPALRFAWENIKHKEAEKGDWFEDWRIIDYLVDEEKQIEGRICDEYCKTIEKIELVLIAKKAIFLRKE